VNVGIPGGAIVTSSQTFNVPCADRVDMNAVIGPQASFVYGMVAASWSGSCTGDAIRSSCVLSAPLPSVSTVVLECGCDPSVFGFASTCGQPFPSPSPFQD
jgi:hypothetical protein